MPLSTAPNAALPFSISKRTLKHIGKDMAPAEFAALRTLLDRWVSEEEEEEEHESWASDSALKLAFDKQTVRSKRRDGQLVVDRTHITKANICPYLGREIPNYQGLGLDPNKIYNLLRDPEEIRKAAATLNGVQLLRKHIPVSADDHKPYDTVGSVGSNAEFDGEYLDNALYVNAQDAIDDIESGKRKELSAGYHYKPDMTPGVFNGTPYDGVMRDIVFNHVALVEDGRAGPDVVVGDSAENLNMAAQARRTAQDQLKATLKLAQDQLENLGGFAKGKDESVSQAQHGAMGAAAGGHSNLGIPKSVGEEFMKADKGKGFDAEPMKAFLKAKGMADDDIAKVMDMLPKPALDQEEEAVTETEEAKGEVVEGAGGKGSENPGGENPTGEAGPSAAAKSIELEGKDAIQFHGGKDQAHDQALIKAVRDMERSVRVALNEVRPWVGDLPQHMAFDTAADVYRHVLVMKGVPGAKTMHPDALPHVLRSLQKTSKKAEATGEHIAMDSSAFGKAKKLAPGLENIQIVG